MPDPLQRQLESLYALTDAQERLKSDPVAFPNRYRGRDEDAELAALVAALLAYGRVSLFWPVLERVFAEMDAAGGPRAYVDGFDIARDGKRLRPLVYRWNRGVDFVLLFAALQRILRGQRLEDVFAGDTAREALTTGVAALRAAMVQVAPACGVVATTLADLPRGARYFVPSPVNGSACKRWNLFLRWVVRPDTEGVDLGLWRKPTAGLVIPLDTHVLRISQFIGLTARKDGSWRTAEEITTRLRAFDADDPVRFDFAIAHLGISGGCLGHRDPNVCPDCPLDPVCTATTIRP